MRKLVCISYLSNQFGGNESELVNHLGKPDAGKPHVRFDEGDGSTWSRPYSTKRNDNSNLNLEVEGVLLVACGRPLTE